MPTIGSCSGRPPVEPKKAASPNAKIPTIGGHEPVAVAVDGRGHPHDRLVEREASRRPVEGGVTEGEDPAVGRNEPVSAAVGSRRHADDRRIEVHAAGRAVEDGVTEGEDAAVGCEQPVAGIVRRGRHADDRRVEVQAPGGPVELGSAVAEDPTVTGDLPVSRRSDGFDGDDQAGLGLDKRLESVTVKVTVYWPEIVGVPLRVPLAAKWIPGGNVPPAPPTSTEPIHRWPSARLRTARRWCRR